MKIFNKISFIIFIVFTLLILVYGSMYLFLLAKGEKMILGGIRNFTSRKVSIGSYSLTPTLKLQLKNLNIEGLVKAEVLNFSPCIFESLTEGIVLNEVEFIRPEFVLERNAGNNDKKALLLAGALGGASPEAISKLSRGPRNIVIPPLLIKRITIKEGKVYIVDRKVSQEGIKITIKDLDFDLCNLFLFPQSLITNFELTGDIPWSEGAGTGKIKAEGWINFFKKDIQVILKVTDIDGLYLYPYYASWIKLNKERIEKAKLDFTSEIQGFNNDVTANCHFELTDVVFKPLSPEEKEDRAEKIAAAVLGMLKSADQGRIKVDFKIKTRLDKPIFGLNNIISAVQEKVTNARNKDALAPEDIILFPGKVVEGTVKGAAEITQAVIVGAAGLGKELKDAVTAPFKRNK